MNHLIKFGSQFHKKFDQITKRAKWSFLGFWLLKGNFWLFDLNNGKPSSHMDSRTQWHCLDPFNKFKRSQMHRIDRWIFQSTDQNLTVYWKVKLWLFGQNQVPRFIFHQDMSKCETFWSRNLILSYENFLFFPNFSQLFHHDAIGFKQNIQHKSCIPTQSLQRLFKKFSQKKLGSQVMIFGTRVPKTCNREILP